MIRWGLIAVGLVTAGLSLVSWWTFVPVREEAEPLSVAEAVSLTRAADKRFVEIDGRIDLSRRVYRSGLNAPAYSAYPPGRPQALFTETGLDHDRLIHLLGSVVTASGKLDPRAVVLEWLDGLEEKTEDAAGAHVTSQRVLAPLIGAERAVFILSPDLPANDRAATDAWFRNDHFQGRLCLFSDLPRNAAGIAGQMGSIRKALGKAGLWVPAHAVVILAAQDTPGVPVHASQQFTYAPVADSGHSLFVQLPYDTDERALTRPTISGIVTPVSGSRYRDFEHVLAGDIAERVGIITLQSGKAYNEQAEPSSLSGVGGGLLWTSIGGMLVIRKRRQNAMEAAGGHPLSLQASADSKGARHASTRPSGTEKAYSRAH